MPDEFDGDGSQPTSKYRRTPAQGKEVASPTHDGVNVGSRPEPEPEIKGGLRTFDGAALSNLTREQLYLLWDLARGMTTKDMMVTQGRTKEELTGDMQSLSAALNVASIERHLAEPKANDWLRMAVAASLRKMPAPTVGMTR